jgi:hypothetical protein
MELKEFLNKISQEENHWMGYHIMMEEIRKYEKKYDAQIQILVK